MTDPAATEQAARVEMDRLARLIGRERDARGHMAALSRAVSDWAAVRRKALHDLHTQLGTWQRVADATGQKLAAVHKAVRRPRKKDQ